MAPAAFHPPLRVAVVDDDAAVRELVRSALSRIGANVDLFPGSQQFLDRAVFSNYDLILCDLMLPGLSGIDLLLEVREKAPSVPFVIISGQAAVTDAIDAMKAGAADFLVKPFRVQALVDLVRRLTQTNTQPRMASGVWSREKEQNFAVGGSPAWKSLLEKARRVAELSSTVLIRGETGTGKEVLAKYIASFGPRAGKPFVTLNCAAIPEELIESELFGHASGTFTAVTGPRKGLFEDAEGGTLFLNEVGSMPGPAQAKVLRALEEFEIRVGENRSVAVDVRILAATNLDLEAAVARQAFRDDLYYRLAVVTLRVPPLRERGEDRLLLADHFLRQFSGPSEYPRSLSPEARDLILHDPFPGNVRELKHAIEQAGALSTKDVLVPDDFPLLLARADEAAASELATSSAVTPRTITPERLKEVLEKTGGNRVEAARQLRISRSTLYRMLGKVPP